MPESLPTDPDMLGAMQAMKRAAKRAREIAEATGTPCYVTRDGKLVDIAGSVAARAQMNSVPQSVRFDETRMWVALTDGRVLGVPLMWFPRLLGATPEERAAVALSPRGLHWEELDEDISISGLLTGRGAG